ncbi:cold-shock protein [uncultured Corynebacterium sp.]|jgi:cold-shock DNA-binding domain protein|uniref:cold-shock protein n=1 Tax=uncultured Corynebacterium sp. TaxID=159447 RepID=UPI0028E2320E|nr:cold-shock protein [uncultured Corynebacterium sp.]
MPIGKVKWYDPDRGFGFISNPDGEDCYVSKSVLPQGVTELHRGQRVDFDFASGARGPQALRMKILDEPRPRSRNRQTKHKYTPEELGSLIADMVTTLEERVQPPLTAGRYPDRKEGKQIAEALRIIAKELDG